MRPARYDIYADRNVPFIQNFDLVGYDLTAPGAAPFFAAQVRFYRDAGYNGVAATPPILDLKLVAQGTPGISIVSVRTENGVPITTFQIFINDDAMKTLPRSGEVGDDLHLVWDLAFGGAQIDRGFLMAGDFIVVARATFP